MSIFCLQVLLASLVDLERLDSRDSRVHPDLPVQTGILEAAGHPVDPVSPEPLVHWVPLDCVDLTAHPDPRVPQDRTGQLASQEAMVRTLHYFQCLKSKAE